MFGPPRCPSCVSKRRDETAWIATFTVGTLNVSAGRYRGIGQTPILIEYFHSGGVTTLKTGKFPTRKTCDSPVKGSRPRCQYAAVSSISVKSSERRRPSGSVRFHEERQRQRRMSPSRCPMCVSKQTETEQPGSPRTWRAR